MYYGEAEMVKKLLRGLTVFTAGAAGLVVAAPGGAAAAPGHAVAVRPAGGTNTLVSVSSTGRSANAESAAMGISAHGRFVAFASGGSNLVPRDTNRSFDVFVRDRLTGITTRESVSYRGAQGNGDSGDGDGAGGGDSGDGALSADGRVVAFLSAASNLVARDTNGTIDVFARDRTRGVTERVSVATNGHQAKDDSIVHQKLAVSANGRFVAFSSDASNLVRGDTNRSPDVFVRDRTRKATERVSVATNGRQGNDLSGLSSSISSDGRYVAFESYASNLVPGDTNGQEDVFVRDRLKKVTVRVSLNSAGHQFTGKYSQLPSISGNGRYVAFLVYENTDPYISPPTILVRDRLRGMTRRVPVPSPSETNYALVSMSQAGRYVCYEAGSNIYIWDQWRNVTRQLPPVGDALSADPILSADGHHVAFDIPLPTLSPDAQEDWAAYAWDDVSDTLVARRFR